MRYLIVGAGGHGQEVAWSLAEHERARGSRFELLFFDDGLPVGPLASGLGLKRAGGVGMVGEPAQRASHAERCEIVDCHAAHQNRP